jgi:DNA processing protein
MSDLFKKLLIIRMPKIGPVRYAELIAKFGSVDAAVDFLNPDSEFRDGVLREMDTAQKMNIHYVSDDSDFYPSALRNLKNHPPIISVRGNLETLVKPTVSIVGTRHATGVGMKFVACYQRHHRTKQC